ncbi:SusC/RagA family TonB-linked outer membrane protein [Chitinophaga barathri]|uniref:SusC/RagA family TonB-linked outer membrane protein n=1 Tax=Chitinophaga barathri TaxID=1647451 RepID=A0A3N4N384_9BACT|nr:SusC/RagA family TonB-linked outer membrane protein [Chitinophaga barathri]RPD42073.1 SusC/RagA family TonB-linked outer membrane protein [Chitinophaga barathri]
MKKRLLLLWAFLLCLYQLSFSQSTPITGKISGMDGAPLPNVSVQVKGTSTGAITNAQGTFSLQAGTDAILIISSIGYLPQQVALKGRSFIALTLETDNKTLNDVVVIGYQSTARKNVTTSISSVSAKDIEPYTSGTVATAIQGKLAGVQIMAADGSVGSQPRILVRGLSSITANTNPLVIVDGMEIGYNFMNTINPLDILSIDVLKDASAASIYGARSGQGVILITTKKGKGAPTINFSAVYGITQSPNVKLAGAQEYAGLMNQIATNSGATLPFPDVKSLSNTNYWDETFGQGNRQNYNLSISGGGNGLSVFGSLGYYSEESYAGKQAGQWKKITGRLNVDWDINKVVKTGINISPRYENYPFAPLNLTWGAFAMDPTVAPFRSEADVIASLPPLTGVFADFMTAFNPAYSVPGRSLFNGLINPEFNKRTNFDKREYFGGQFSTYLEIKPFKGLVLKSVLDATANFSQQNNYAPKYYFAPNSYNAKTAVTSATAQNSRVKITSTADYTLPLPEEHSVNVLLGHSYDSYSTKGTNASRENIPFDSEPFRYINAGNLVTGASGGYQPGAAPFGKMLSFFGSLRYNYKEKYYLTGTMRADASSLVNPLYRWGYFPSVSGAWVISQESFFDPLKDHVSFLKLRASWGKSGGNLPGSVGDYMSYVNMITYVDATGKVINGYTPGSINNPELKWEIQQDFTVGLDAALFNDKLNISIDRYTRNPKNLLLPVRVDPSLGYPQGYIPTQYANVGEMTTKGWDVAVGYKDNITRKLSYGVNLTLTQFKSEVDYLSSSDPIIGGENNEVISTFRSRTTVGHAPGAWWGFTVDGVFQTDQEASSYVNKNGERLQPQATAGDLKFRDFNNDGKIDNNDMSDLGSPYPKFSAGLALTLAYGNFDFRTELYGVFGQQNFNQYRRNMIAGGNYNFISGFQDQYWHGEGTSNSFPVLRKTDLNGNFTKMSTFFLEKGNFLRANLMQIGYKVPEGLIKGIKNLRVYVSAQNLFTISNYSGLNPDIPWYSTISYAGNDNYQMVPPRLYTFGLNLAL